MNNESLPLTVVDVPDRVKPLLLPLIGLSAVGLALSLWVHIGALAGHKVAPQSLFIVLHIGIFVVWLPAILVAKTRIENLQRGDFWKAVLSGAPDWIRYLVYGFTGYALVNFLLFMFQAPQSPHGNPPPVVWRGFSGHWMAFYSAALAIFYSAAVSSRSTNHSSL